MSVFRHEVEHQSLAFVECDVGGRASVGVSLTGSTDGHGTSLRCRRYRRWSCR
jgi:hypothetical protein